MFEQLWHRPIRPLMFTRVHLRESRRSQNTRRTGSLCIFIFLASSQIPSPPAFCSLFYPDGRCRLSAGHARRSGFSVWPVALLIARWIQVHLSNLASRRNPQGKVHSGDGGQKERLRQARNSVAPRTPRFKLPSPCRNGEPCRVCSELRVSNRCNGGLGIEAENHAKVALPNL